MPTPVDHPDLLYISAPDVSDAFWAELREIVPTSPNGVDPFLKPVWGMDRLEYISGFWDRRYGDTENEPPKYIGREAWVWEAWQSPDVFDREQWEQVAHLVGEWPANGVWDMVSYHVNEDGSYKKLEDGGLDIARSWKYHQNLGRQRSIDILMEQKMARYSFQQQRQQERASAVAEQFGEDVVRIFDRQKDQVSTSGRNIGYKKTEGGILIPN